jgi:hypothetical protein
VATAESLPVAPALAGEQARPVPWFLGAVLFGSTSIVLGLIWDICWHRTIGRDTFWSPPHLAIYLGGIVAGLSSAAVILRTTLRGSALDRAGGVRVWGLTGPLGAFLCGWGAGAMLVSAPFDDWWHNAYGLDVKIISPPHAVLALGITAIQVGAMVAAVALQNRQGERRGARLAYAGAAGLLLTNTALMVYEYTIRILMHSSIFYIVAGLAFPLFLVAAARASRLRWPATAAAAVYTAILLAMLWVLPLFPAEPRLGPVRQHVTHMVPLQFPLLLLAPALALDLILRRWKGRHDWVLAFVLGTAFVGALLAVQWPFASFLLSPSARNWIFATHVFPYYMSPTSYAARHQFYPWDASTAALLRGLLLALPLAALSSRLGLAWGGWMSRVRR